jgi:hypothetical protein
MAARARSLALQPSGECAVGVEHAGLAPEDALLGECLAATGRSTETAARVEQAHRGVRVPGDLDPAQIVGGSGLARFGTSEIASLDQGGYRLGHEFLFEERTPQQHSP